jgi:tRNA 2-selenouridine synthase
MREPAPVTVAQLSEFDEIIDVRSQSEFAADHVSGAVNCPVLDDEQRARVGTLYKQRSPFEARKIGAALVSASIARHLQDRFLDRPREWRPLVYCWRGGQRSAAFARVLAEIGWHVGQLEGGYRAYRSAVISSLAGLPRRLRWRVVCGLTGTGKSRLLQALRDAGAQVLDLEALAAHRGSVLGNLPGQEQPPQKLFESMLWRELSRCDPERPVYAEAESRRIGRLNVPGALIESMREGECIALGAPLPVRVALLMREYAHFIEHPATLLAAIEELAPLYGRPVIAGWKERALAGAWSELTEELLVKHYDPAYARALMRNYPSARRAPALELEDASDSSFAALARRCLARG